MAPRRSIERGKTAAWAASEERTGVITSRENHWLKLFRSILRGMGNNCEGDLIAIESPKLVGEALRSGLEAHALLVSASGERHMERILRAASESEAGVRRERILKTTDRMFATVAGTETPQGVAALFRRPLWGFEDVVRGRETPDGAFRSASPLVVVLAGVQDPGNVGTILRSAEAFGATGVVTTRGTADPWSSKALRASAGSALRLPVLRGMGIPALLAQLKMHLVKIVAASVRPGMERREGVANGDVLRGPAALFVGSESAGLPAEVEQAADATISIPMRESVESLNAAVAASVVLYEAARQRKAF